MRRADRLFRIVSLLRSGRMMTGAQLAERLQISPRTLYRDIADLQRTGTPILGETGVGYTLRRDEHIPPMHFTPDELTALVLGARMAGAWGSESTATAANDALVKIEAALPEAHRSRVDRVLLFAPGFTHPAKTRKLLDRLHRACTEQRVTSFAYTDEQARETDRSVHPLGLFFGATGGRWLHGAARAMPSATFALTGCAMSPWQTRRSTHAADRRCATSFARCGRKVRREWRAGSSIAADMALAMDTANTRRYTPPWVFGILYGGMFNGFAAVSLSQLLPDRGVSLARESEIAVAILTASYISFLFTPLVDCGLPRRVWAGILICIAALCLGVSVPMLNKAAANGGHGAGTLALIAVLFTGYLCNQMYTSTIGGMVPNLVAPSKHGAVSAWMNIAYLALTGAGGALCVWEIRTLPLSVTTWLVPLPILIGAVPLFFLPPEERTLRTVGAAMRQLFTDLKTTARKPSYLFALLVFVVPSATFALQNLFGGMGADFHASAAQTNLSVGLLFTIACALGAAIGGPLSSRIDRRLLFIAPAMIAALGNLVMVFGPHTPWMFAGGLFFYNLMAGVNYTATSALVFQIVGRDNPLSATQYSVCIAACNLAIAGSTFMDGRGAGRSGADGALLVDAGLSLVLGAIVLGLVWRFGGGFPRPPATGEDLALDGKAV